MTPETRQSGFTLVELLIVIAIIAILGTIILPAVSGAVDLARNVACINNLRNLGTSMGLYHGDNRSEFWPCTSYNTPRRGVTTYFWGTNTDPVETSPSPLMEYCQQNLSALSCPKQPWGSYVPQGGVSEPTTNYGYNARCLDPPSWFLKDKYGLPIPRKKTHDLTNPGKLFVFADSAMYWAPGGVPILQNSTHLEPVTGTWVQTPTTHFRHGGETNALCADGSADTYGTEGWVFGEKYKPYKLGFVGTENYPHYDQK